jgi:fluoride exporter
VRQAENGATVETSSLGVLLAIAGAGAAGSVARYLLGNWLQRTTGASLPLGTLAVNIAGSFFLGVVMTLFALRGELDSKVRIALTVGLLGGFTTYSSFAYETLLLLERRQFAAAAAYVGLTLVGAASAGGAGIALARAVR